LNPAAFHFLISKHRGFSRWLVVVIRRVSEKTEAEIGVTGNDGSSIPIFMAA